MKVKTELVKKYIASRICDYMNDIIEFDADKIVNTKAIEILQEIQNGIQNNADDFGVCRFLYYKNSNNSKKT